MTNITDSEIFAPLEEIEVGTSGGWSAAEAVFGEADWESDTEADTETDWQSDTETDWQSDTETDTETDWQSDTETDTETNWQSDTEAAWEIDEIPNDLEIDAYLPEVGELNSPNHTYPRHVRRHRHHQMSSTGIAARIAYVAEQQHRRWHPSTDRTLVETDPEATLILQDYYRTGAGMTVTTNQLQNATWQRTHPWSAVFVSWVLKQAGAGAAFPYSTSHQDAIRAARHSRLTGDRSNPFWAYRTTEIAPQVGDLVCTARNHSGATYDTIADPQSRTTHCDIVTAVRPGEIRVIGGNVRKTVGARTLRTDPGGRLCLDREQAEYFAVIRCNDPIASREAWGEEAARWPDFELGSMNEEDAESGSEVVTFTAHTLPIRVAVFATKAARQAGRVEVLMFAHGLDLCRPVLGHRPATFITKPPFNLGDLVEASGRPIVLIVPFLDWENLAKNKMGFGPKWHKLAQPANFNGVVTEALQRVGSPSVQRLILAGHSRAYGIFDALANAHADPEMSKGPLSHLSHIWALDTAYASPVADWMAWLGSRNDLHMTVIYRYGDSVTTGPHGSRFRAQVPKSGGRLQVFPVQYNKVEHCAVPRTYLPRLLSSLPLATPKLSEAPIFDEWEAPLGLDDFGGDNEVDESNDEEFLDQRPLYGESDGLEAAQDSEESEPEMEAFGAFAELEDDAGLDGETLGADGGLTPSELKAVQITSTFETGKPGGFYGLSGNFDGYGISFGLVNWNIGTGSLQPLLRDFASTEPARWKSVFGPDASSFAALMSRKDRDAVKDQLRFAIQTMNTSQIVRGKARWSVSEPWVTYFKRLAADPAFQRIQVRHVRDLLDRARYFCDYFGLKSEMSFAFMFDTVASHGQWWLTKKWKDGIAKRQQLLHPRLSALEAKYGKGRIPERDMLLAIADVLAETSSTRWRDNVLRRKRWFVTGEHPRANELRGLTPRPDAPYQAAATAHEVTSSDETRPPTDRTALIAAAYKQATTAGTEADRTAIGETLKLNGTDTKTWFAGMVPDATFLGRPIRASGGTVPGVHRALFDVLQRAERELLNAHPGRSAAQLGKQLGIRDIGGLRPPKKATGGTLPSLHCFGLAIDINYPTNPFVGNHKSGTRSPSVVERAMWLLHGMRFNVAAPLSATSAGPAWDIHHRASQALAEYLRLADDADGARLRQLVAKAQARGEPNGLDWWKRRVVADLSAIKTGDFQHHPHPELTGYLDLPRELVVALANAGLLWGGLYRGAKDIMHFDLRSGPLEKRAG